MPNLLQQAKNAVWLIVLCSSFQTHNAMAQESKNSPVLSIVDSNTAWGYLPKEAKSSNNPLPCWARAMAPSLPFTTCAMLEFDYLARTSSEPGPRIRGLVRAAAAQVNKSDYGRRLAKSDMLRAGLNKEWIEQVFEQPEKLEADDLEIYDFAYQMSQGAFQIKDEVLARLEKRLGEETLVGMVLQIGYANMQDRLIHALRLAEVDSEILPPLAVAFVDSTPTGREAKPADRPPLPQSPAEYSNPNLPDASQIWAEMKIEEIRKKLDQQKERVARIRIPEWDEIKAKLPPGLYPNPLRIRWSRVVVGHQPQLGPAWIKCLRVFEVEAHQERVFEESVFWVVTRTLRCFYCMGHCEMLMEVGGLKRKQIDERTHQLSQGSWTEFGSHEQLAFRYAKKLSEAPWQMTNEDFSSLKIALGTERAIDLVWWVSRCHLMTKVSDAFQLNLEYDNVFSD